MMCRVGGGGCLERLSEPRAGWQVVEADERAGEVEEGLVDVGPALVADGEPAVAGEPGQGPLNDPAVATEPLAGVDAASGDPRDDPASAEIASAAREVVALVGVQLGRA